MRHLVLCTLLTLSSLSCFAGVGLPKQLTRDDRQETLRVIGLGGSTKILSDPYPLGGYAGFEMGVTASRLAIRQLDGLGDGTHNTPTSYNTLSIGKGLYNDFDIFVNFTPWSRSDGLMEYGGSLRWSFYHAKYWPIQFAIDLHSNVINMRNALTTNSFGADLLASLNYRNFALYAGGGHAQASGHFEAQHTDSGANEADEASTLHGLLGVVAHWEHYFLALQADQYTTSVYSAKLGLRF